MYDKPSKQRPVLLAGLVIAGLSGLPGISIINCCCCAGIIFGGAFGSYLHRQDYLPDHPPMESSDALIVGLLAGLVGAFGATLLSTLVAFAIGPIESEFVMNFMRKVIDQLVENGSLPSSTADDIMQQMEDSMQDAVSPGAILVGFFFNIIIFPIFGMLGGLVGFGLFKPKVPPATAHR
ncbi:MAG: hypothetical protein MUE68_06040 [Bacteroidetes bacterium]|jgi:predicted membrane-bound spermidine synthase|nr:hypothetical protein [Bacteroidota bacterium]